MQTRGGLMKALGPGLLFAGAAIGVSHLVQSTRAGAEYSLALLGFVILANIVKYPAFLIGNQYAAATGENLIDSYRRQGIGAVILFVLATLVTMFVGCAAISVTTAALLKINFAIELDLQILVLCVWAFIITILFFGQYKALDLIIKTLLAFLTMSTMVATILIIPRLFGSEGTASIAVDYDTATILFIAALVGWMPAPLDTSVWQSLWSQARTRSTNYTPNRKETAADFNIGFFATTVLAICFVLMGAGVMYGAGVAFEAGAVGFAGQVIDLYRSTLGNKVAIIVGIAAMAVVFSTTLTAIDAWPRTMAAVFQTLRGEDEDSETDRTNRHPFYWAAMGVLLLGAWVILFYAQNAFRTLVDISTTVSFLMAPVFAYLNHQAMFGGIVAEQERPANAIRLWSLAGVTIMGVFAIAYLIFRFL